MTLLAFLLISLTSTTLPLQSRPHRLSLPVSTGLWPSLNNSCFLVPPAVLCSRLSLVSLYVSHTLLLWESRSFSWPLTVVSTLLWWISPVTQIPDSISWRNCKTSSLAHPALSSEFNMFSVKNRFFASTFSSPLIHHQPFNLKLKSQLWLFHLLYYLHGRALPDPRVVFFVPFISLRSPKSWFCHLAFE